MSCGCCLIELDAQPRALRRQQVAVLEFYLYRDDIRKRGARTDRQFLNGEAGDQHVNGRFGGDCRQSEETSGEVNQCEPKEQAHEPY